MEVLPITGDASAPKLGGNGPVLDWAVKMHTFDANATLDKAASITPEQIDAIADQIACFHQNITIAPANSEYGSPEQVQAPVLQNTAQIRSLSLPPPSSDAPSSWLLDALIPVENWSRAEGLRLMPHFAERKSAGFIRECHGDLHLGNIAWIDNAPLIFDGIEFNPALRFIDVISEIAFLMMDLMHRGQSTMAWRVLNRYLEQTGDYAGLAALPYYLSYRAMVRAKVSAIRAYQEGGQGNDSLPDLSECLSYLRLAGTISVARTDARSGLNAPIMIMMHGVSGSGKSVIAQQLLEDIGAIRLRADVERKRLFNLNPLDSSRHIPGGIYTREAGGRTRDRLLALTSTLLREGFHVIVDATFLAIDWRSPFEEMATTQRVAWFLVSPDVPHAELRRRVESRAQSGQDASEATVEVLDAQLASFQALSRMEMRHTVQVPTGATPGATRASTLAALRALREVLCEASCEADSASQGKGLS